MTEVVAEIQGEVAAPKRKRNGALVKAETAPAPAPTTPGGPSLLAILQAVMTDPTASIERLNSAFDFYQRIESAKARKAFDSAMAAAKSAFGTITKRHTVSRQGSSGKDGGTFKHEDLADIAVAVDQALSANGLSYRFRATSNPNEPIKVTCIVTHEDGHFEETSLSAGADPSGGKNGIQAIGSTLSYLQRYSLRLALGIAAGREDDGNAAGEKQGEFITEQQADGIRTELDELGADVQKFCEALGVEAIAKIPTGKIEAAKVIIGMKRKSVGQR